MRLTRAAPARPTSSRTPPTTRLSAPFTLVNSGLAELERRAVVVRRARTEVLAVFPAGFFFIFFMTPSHLNGRADASTPARVLRCAQEGRHEERLPRSSPAV